jgi:ketosteroid isomerase-like protein
MENREELLNQIRRAYSARDKGELEALMAEFHSEAVFTLSGDQQILAVAGSALGHTRVKEGMAKFITTFEFVTREFLSELVDGDRAAVHSRMTVRMIGSINSQHKTDLLDLFRFKDGKIIELIEFADTALIGKMMP